MYLNLAPSSSGCVFEGLKVVSLSWEGEDLVYQSCDCVCGGNGVWSLLYSPGPGDVLESASRDTTTPISAHFPKTPHAPPTPPSVGTTPSLPVPDLDRSAISVAQDHITSGSTSSTVNLSGDYKDASGKVIRRYDVTLILLGQKEVS